MGSCLSCLSPNRNAARYNSRRATGLDILDPRKCTITSEQAAVVGENSVAVINLICNNWRPYTCSHRDVFRAHVVNTATNQEVNCVIEPSGSLVGCSQVTVSFTVRVSGEYTARFMMNEQILGREQRIVYTDILSHIECNIIWRQLQPFVGELTVADIELVCDNGRPYTCSTRDVFKAHVVNTTTNQEVNCVVEPSGSLVGRSRVTVSFTVTVAGEYLAKFMINEQIVGEEQRIVYHDNLDHRQCKAVWRPLQPVVGELNVADIKLVCCSGRPYTFKNTDSFRAYVVKAGSNQYVNCVVGPGRSLTGSSELTVSFTVNISGEYLAKFMINGKILDKEHKQLILAGPPDKNKTIFDLKTVNLIMKCETIFPIIMTPKDSYGNNATLHETEIVFKSKMNDSNDASSVNVTCIVSKLFNFNEERYEILVKLAEPGYYHCSVKHMDKTLKTIDAIVLTDKDTKRMENNRKVLVFQIGYNCKKIKGKKKKDARCFISPTMLQVRRHNFIGVTIKKYTFKVCRSTQFIMHSSPEMFTIDDGIIPPLTLTSPDRDLIAAVYHYFIEKKFDECGFSFQDKRAHFQSKLKQNSNSDRPRIDINIERSQILESAMDATKNFSKNEWKKSFFIKFDEEAGIDCNGVSREFINCLCDVMFSGRNSDGLFRAFEEDDTQSLVHPNCDKKRNRHYDLRYYYFAGLIVGKCLFETAMGNTLMVRAKFTRSFLAQIIGLRLTWKYFETDDPDLYNCKVKYIKDGSLSDLGMDLTFAEEEYDSSSKNPRLVQLVPDGARKPVTESNKMYYLNKLAQYRLCSRVSKEVDEFIKGLNLLVPAELFNIFDENELELLMCGLQELSVQDLRLNSVVRGVSGQTVEWFWMSVNQLSQEELARLVQFVTGSSQVPIGGFAELQPQFTILCSGETGNRLPYAHTCFNHLCLPDCESYEQFNNVLMTAIREGAEGLLMS